MKKIVNSFFIAVCVILLYSPVAKADLVSYSLGMPVSFGFTKNADNDLRLETQGGPSGEMVHIQLPIFMGFVFERYEQKLKYTEAFFTKPTDWAEVPGLELKLRLTAYDLFLTLPIPIIKLTLGVGLVKTEMVSSDPDIDPYANMWSTQKYIQVGIPILVIFDIHVSYHQIAGTMKPKDELKYSKYGEIPIDGDMYAIGASVGF